MKNIPYANIVSRNDMVNFRKEIDQLARKLEMVNSFNEEGLKKLLKVALMGQDMNKITTGYMGLLEMARRSGHKLSYSFEEVNDDYSYYTITVRVRAKDLKSH